MQKRVTIVFNDVMLFTESKPTCKMPRFVPEVSDSGMVYLAAAATSFGKRPLLVRS